MDKSVAKSAVVMLMLFASTILASTPESAPLAGDRVVVEVNGSSCTQRMIESYVLIRSALGADAANVSIDPPGPGNWNSALNIYIEEQLILQEAQRAGSFSPSAKTIETAVQMVDNALQSQPAAKTKLDSLYLSASQKGRIVGWILKVEGFRKTKQRQNQEEGVVPRGGDKASAKESWLKDLQDRAVVRYLAGSSNYRPIQPPAPK